ncbi:pyruvate dehydrogenase [Streptomyces sp. NBC_00988]|uniref:transketolase-like TK C-terminal-containing protein n=1 Tax=Streptomyces sp. NBC_00988 TaxID=2903704 RepID=UPI0038695E38|nr:pyruvate dehydrogenase [Streptomyces sp. NBC_00988]
MTTALTPVTPPLARPGRDLDLLRVIERRVLWLATKVVDHANHARSDASGIKTGGHQASSASMATIMTALWFDALTSADRVSVKPHASPVLHAVNYLLGGLDSSYLTTLRAFGGLQSYPSRTKDPDQVDYSTGSVGLGATAPLWGAVARRYLDSHHPNPGGEGRGRQFALIGDAELDEGAVWEALRDPMTADLGEVVWVVDLNRQSLDRVMPGIEAQRLSGMFEAAGWQCLTLKYGSRLEELFALPGGGAELRARLDLMSNQEYQYLLRSPAAELRERLPGTGRPSAALAALIAGLDDRRLTAAFADLGGHDLGLLLDTFDRVDDTRPTVVFAYTVKGYGLPTAGHPQNHSALLTHQQMEELAAALGVDPADPWARFPDGSAGAAACATAAARLRRPPVVASRPPSPPADLGRTPSGRISTQDALGRVLLDLTRRAPEVAERIVTVSPDVASSTNLGGWINKVGVWSAGEPAEPAFRHPDSMLRWQESGSGRHIELGIAETNLVGLLGELGATWSRWGQPLLPIGTVYDPFVTRAAEPWSFGIYAGGQSILVGTPSGVTLAPEGGAHQSVVTPSLGIEQPGCTAYEPAFAQDVEWCLLKALGEMGRSGGGSFYFRLSTLPVDQSLAAVPEDPAARARRRRQALAGGYVLRTATRPRVRIAAMGATVPQALAAAEDLGRLGCPAEVICVTSADLLFRAVRARSGHPSDSPLPLLTTELFPDDRPLPLVTVVDAHPHTLAFLAGPCGGPAAHLGVTGFGQSGALEDVLRHHRIDHHAVTDAALALLGRHPTEETPTP